MLSRKTRLRHSIHREGKAIMALLSELHVLISIQNTFIIFMTDQACADITTHGGSEVCFAQHFTLHLAACDTEGLGIYE